MLGLMRMYVMCGEYITFRNEGKLKHPSMYTGNFSFCQTK